MPKLLRVAFAAVFLVAAAPALAQAPGESPPPMEESVAFVGRLGEVTQLQVDGVKKLLDAQPLFDRMATPAGAKAAAPQVRRLMAEARATVQQADAMTARIVPPPGLRFGTLEPATMLAEARSQNAKTLALFLDFDAFLAAAERGDRTAMTRAAPRLMEGSFLLIDGSAAMYRNRQAAIASTQSVHQALEIGVQLYRAMSASGRAWIAAKTGGAPGAAANLRTQLAQISSRVRAASSAGRANLARELDELDRRIAAVGLQGEEAATVGRIRQALAGKEKLFAVGDELAATAAAAAGQVTASALAAQPSPQLLGRFAPLEVRFQGALAEQAAIATGKAQ